MRFRQSLAVLIAVGLVTAAVGIGAPAQAAPVDGVLAIRGPGSLYAGEPGDGGQVSLPALAGASATYSVEVINTGSELAQFLVRFTAQPGTVVTVTKGSTVVSNLALGPDGYYTAPIAPGRIEVLAVKVAIPKGTSQRELSTGVELLAVDGTHLSSSTLTTEVPGTGHSISDIYARQGNQAYVGGALNQVASSPAVKKGSTVTFNLKVQNDGTTSRAIGIFLVSRPSCGTLVVKDGSTDITARFSDDGTTVRGYPTPTLKPGASKVLNVVYTRTEVTGCGTVQDVGFQTLYGFFEGGESVRMLIPMARS